jgi:hypothetical protein
MLGVCKSEGRVTRTKPFGTGWDGRQRTEGNLLLANVYYVRSYFKEI